MKTTTTPHRYSIYSSLALCALILCTSLGAQAQVSLPAAEQSALTIPSITTEVYGSACGIVGADPEMRVYFEEMLAAQNMLGLEQWLYSNRPARNAYAVEGYHRLLSQGLELSEADRDRISVVRAMSKEVETCSGCLGSKLPLSYVLERFHFD